MRGPSEIVITAWARLVRAQRAVMAGIEGELKQAGFPPLSWYDVLLELKRRPDGRLTPRELEQEMLFEQYNLSRLLDRMEAEGLVRRIPYPGDKRRQLIEITEEGRSLQRRIWPVYAAAIEQYVGAKLTEGEVQVLAEALKKLLAADENERARPLAKKQSATSASDDRVS
ncbi:helix-turn-helix domain-containing protein [Sinorhizobium sp. 8-89]|uniref:MarR family winged helix-turn-helix transcriptional regulator n=1 Tax=Sinorhizobium sp. 7-81 TaxID=3049087 RepID=UPI0024C297AD|nr:helix-turn-helix domain-containing protein [Sinorhizobium sp. 7-81]MDK1387982.1 helix-turn-helix domain-containing protein [Sinorhizobium sp. 7-81]